MKLFLCSFFGLVFLSECLTILYFHLIHANDPDSCNLHFKIISCRKVNTGRVKRIKGGEASKKIRTYMVAVMLEKKGGRSSRKNGRGGKKLQRIRRSKNGKGKSKTDQTQESESEK